MLTVTVAQAAPVVVTMQGTITNPDDIFYVWQPDELAAPVTLQMEYDPDWVGEIGGSDLYLEYVDFPLRMTLTTLRRTLVAQGPWGFPIDAEFDIYGGSTFDNIEMTNLPIQGGGYFHWDFDNLANDKKLPTEFSQANFNQSGRYLAVAIDTNHALVSFNPANVTVTLVPEPAALGALGTAALLVLGRRRRRGV